MTLEQTNSRTSGSDAPRPSGGVGQYDWDVLADSWWWSDDLYRLYGYEPGSVEGTTDRFLQHKHPDDKARIDAVFSRALSQGGPFSCYHRIIDTSGRQRTVVIVGYGHRDAANTQTLSVHGYMVDVTSSSRRETDEALQALLVNRAGIEQVKGALMLVLGLDDEGAFEVLRGHSQVYNKKLSEIVAALLVAFRERGTSDGVNRAELDQMLFNASH